MNLNPIPLEFSNGLTTTEWLLGIQAKVNECVDVANAITDESKIYTDNMFNTAMDIINIKAETLNNTINATKSYLKDYTDGEITIVKNMISSMVEELNTEIEKGSLLLDELNKRLTLVEKLIDNGYVYVNSPLTGQKVSIQSATDELYSLIMHGDSDVFMTALLYDTKQLTAESYDALGVTARAYDRNEFAQTMYTNGFSEVLTSKAIDNESMIQPQVTFYQVTE